MNNITGFGSIARSNVKYRSSLSSIRYIKKILINISEELDQENNAETTEIINNHIATLDDFHDLTTPYHSKAKIKYIVTNIYDDLRGRGIYSGDKDNVINSLLQSLKLYTDDSSPNDSLLDTKGFREVFFRMLYVNEHDTLEFNLDQSFIELPKSIISYHRGVYANYALIDPKLFAMYLKAEDKWLANRLSTYDCIDYSSFSDNAKATMPTRRGWYEVISMTPYGEAATTEVSRKRVNYYEEAFRFDIRDNPSPAQEVYTSNLRCNDCYSKVHNVLGFNENIGISFELDLRASTNKNVDIFNLVGRSKSQMALVVHNNQLRIELDCFDIDKSVVIIDDLTPIQMIQGYLEYNNGSITITYMSNGQVSRHEITQEVREYWEAINYLFIGPKVDLYKRDCIRIGYIEIYNDELTETQIEAMLQQRGKMYG